MSRGSLLPCAVPLGCDDPGDDTGDEAETGDWG